MFRSVVFTLFTVASGVPFAHAQSVNELAKSAAALAYGAPSIVTEYSDPAVVQYVEISITSMTAEDRQNLTQAMALNGISQIRLSNHFAIYESTWSRWKRKVLDSDPEYVLNLPASNFAEAENALAQLYPALISRRKIQAVLPGIQVNFKLDSRIHFDFAGIEGLIDKNVGAVFQSLDEKKVTHLEFSDRTRLLGSLRQSDRTLLVRYSSRPDGSFDSQASLNALLN